jgi:hypothetical protein
VIGTTDPLPADYAIYLQARRTDSERANVSEPASIDETWNWNAHVEVPKGDYALKAVTGPLEKRVLASFERITGEQVDRATVDTYIRYLQYIRSALAYRTPWTDRYASAEVVVTVP